MSRPGQRSFTMGDKLYVHLRDEPAKLYDNRLLNYLTYSHILVPWVLFGPVITYMLYRTYYSFEEMPMGGFQAAALFFTGWFIWSFYEYITHRFLLHNKPKSKWGKKWAFRMHGVHHAYPNDRVHMLMAPVASIPLAIIFVIFFYSALGPRDMAPAFAGFGWGCLVDDTLHYMVHVYDWNIPIFQKLKRYHMRHHFVDPDENYGFLITFWDKVFGNYRGPVDTPEDLPSDVTSVKKYV